MQIRDFKNSPLEGNGAVYNIAKRSKTSIHRIRMFRFKNNTVCYIKAECVTAGRMQMQFQPCVSRELSLLIELLISFSFIITLTNESAIALLQTFGIVARMLTFIDKKRRVKSICICPLYIPPLVSNVQDIGILIYPINTVSF